MVMIVFTQINALSAYPDYTDDLWLQNFLIQTRLGSIASQIFLFSVLFIYLLLAMLCSACMILIPHAGIEPEHLAVKVLSAKHWTIREFPQTFFSEWTNVICCR